MRFSNSQLTHAGKIGGREAMRRWYREGFATELKRSLAYFAVEWYMIDE